MHEPIICPACGKRCFTSIHLARRILRRARFRLRFYHCDAGALHVANAEKR